MFENISEIDNRYFYMHISDEDVFAIAFLNGIRACTDYPICKSFRKPNGSTLHGIFWVAAKLPYYTVFVAFNDEFWDFLYDIPATERIFHIDDNNDTNADFRFHLLNFVWPGEIPEHPD